LKILVIEKEVNGVTKEKFIPYLKTEAQRVWELYQNGFIREIYFSKDSHNAVIILECSDGSEAENILNTLPLVKEKLISFNIFPLEPNDGFARLFEKTI
jgi:hypothetical protein